MPEGLVSMQDQFSGLDMAALVGGPLKAACDAGRGWQQKGENHLVFVYPGGHRAGRYQYRFRGSNDECTLPVHYQDTDLNGQ